jgi:DNA topoisomerase-2
MVNLFNLGYTPMSKINIMKMKSSLEDEVINENQDEEDDISIPAKEFDYLLSMPLWSLTYEKVEELLNNKENKLKEIEILSNTSEKTFWENDLSEFIKVLDEVEAKEEADRIGSNKIKRAKVNNGKGKVKQGKNEKKNKKNSEEMLIETEDKLENKNLYKLDVHSEVKDLSKLSLLERLAMKSIYK